MGSAPTRLADVFGPVFERLFDDDHELVGEGAVDDAMVVTEGEVNDGTDGDGIGSVFVGDDHGLLGDSADAHDGDVRLVDDGQAENGSELTRIRDSEGRAFDVGGHELLGAGAFAEVGDAALQSEEVELVGALEDGNDESPIEGDGDSGIDVLVVANGIAFEGAVDDGILLQGDDRGADEEGHEGKARAMPLLESALEFVAEIDDAGHIHFEHAVDVSAGAAGLDHALGNDLAHLRHGHQVAGSDGRRGSLTRGGSGDWRRGGGSWGSDAAVHKIEDVLFGDAATGSGARDPCEVDVIFAGEFADERRGANIGIVFFGVAGGGAGEATDGEDFAGAGAAAGAPFASPMMPTMVLT